VVQHAVSSDSPLLGLRYAILIESSARRGQEHPAFFKYQAEGDIWGTYYGAVRFDHASHLILAEDGSILGRWMPQTWYAVRVLLDRKARTYDVWINGAQVGDDLALSAHAPDLIDAVALVAGHAGVPVYYDDVAVFTPDADRDGDGIPDDVDPCPFVNPGLIDINVDGCVDTSLVIAAYLKENIVPLADELPYAAVGCWEGAVVDLSTNALAASLEDMLCVAVTLDAAGTQTAAEAAHINGLAAQTTALLAIDQQAQLVGEDDPNVIAATTLVEIGIAQLEQMQIVDAVNTFTDAVDELFEIVDPAILVEVSRRNVQELLWEHETSTFAAWRERVYYPIRVTNVGNVGLSNVRVWQTRTDFFKNIGVLAVGESRILNQDDSDGDRLEYRVQRSDPDPFVIISSAAGEYKGRIVKDAATAEIDIIHPSIDLVVTAPAAVRVGEMASFRFTVTNTGDVPLHKVLLGVGHPLTFFQQIGELAPGESRYFPVHYLVPEIRRNSIKMWISATGRREMDSGFPEQIVRDNELVEIRIIRR
jgi:hypothetical protein